MLLRFLVGGACCNGCFDDAPDVVEDDVADVGRGACRLMIDMRFAFEMMECIMCDSESVVEGAPDDPICLSSDSVMLGAGAGIGDVSM